MKTPRFPSSDRSPALSPCRPAINGWRPLARRLRALVTLPLFVAVLGGGCATRESRGTDSNTNFLKPCTGDDECGGLTCLCGQCSRTCEANANCSSLPGGVCRPNGEHPSACGADPGGGACAVACGSDRDCTALGLTCVLGFCEASALAKDGGFAGASGASGSNQGAGGAAGGTAFPGGTAAGASTGIGGIGGGAGSGILRDAGSAGPGGGGFAGPGGGGPGGQGGVGGAPPPPGGSPGAAGVGGAPPPPGATFSVAADGYVTSTSRAGGTWMGYAYTATDLKSATTITPAEVAGGSLCASGTVAGTADYSAVAMLELNLNQASADAGGPFVSPRLTWSPSGGGIFYSVSNTHGSTLRIQIQAAGGDTDPSKRWCSPITSSSGVIPWSTFNTACWDGSGTNYDGTTPLQSAMVVVPGYLTPVRFNFCLNSMGPS
jgi:hypothetical protein